MGKGIFGREAPFPPSHKYVVTGTIPIEQDVLLLLKVSAKITSPFVEPLLQPVTLSLVIAICNLIV